MAGSRLFLSETDDGDGSVALIGVLCASRSFLGAGKDSEVWYGLKDGVAGAINRTDCL